MDGMQYCLHVTCICSWNGGGGLGLGLGLNLGLVVVSRCVLGWVKQCFRGVSSKAENRQAQEHYRNAEFDSWLRFLHGWQ